MEKDIRDITTQKLRTVGCVDVKFDVPLGRGRARADAIGYLFKAGELSPAVLLEMKAVFSLDSVPKLMKNAERIHADLLAITDGEQWAWYQNVEDAWRRRIDAPSLAELMANDDIQALPNYLLKALIDDLLATMRSGQQASLSDLGIILYAFQLWQEKSGGEDELNVLLADSKTALGDVMSSLGYGPQWARITVGDSGVRSIVEIIVNRKMSSSFSADLLVSVFFNEYQSELVTTNVTLANIVAEIIDALTPVGGIVLDPAAGDGAILTATMLNRPDLSYCAHDNNPNVGFLSRFLFAAKGVSLDYNQLDYIRSVPSSDLQQVDLVVVDPPLGLRIDAEEVLRQYELSRGKPTAVEVLFLERTIAQLKPGGHLLMLIPTSILMKSTDRHVREFILRECNIHAVLEIPASLRNPGVGSKACLLVCQKKGEEATPVSDVVMSLVVENSLTDAETDFREAVAMLIEKTLQGGEVL